MPSDNIFKLQPDVTQARTDAQQLFDQCVKALGKILPSSAEIHHIGATAIPGCLTKGDLDIAVRVPAKDFAAADSILATRYQRNKGSIKTPTFSAFEDSKAHPHLGIQLTTVGGPYDNFLAFVDILKCEQKHLDDYNDLKRKFDGKSMDEYRKAKDAFVSKVLRTEGK